MLVLLLLRHRLKARWVLVHCSTGFISLMLLQLCQWLMNKSDGATGGAQVFVVLF